EEDAGHPARPGALPHCRKLARKGACIALLVDAAMAHMAVEVAIGTLGRAERPVQIDAKAGIVRAAHASNSALASSAKARVRCDRPSPSGPPPRPCFSSEVISPKVRSPPSGRNIGS